MRPLPAMIVGTMVLMGSVPTVTGCVGPVGGQVTAENSYTVTEPVTSIKIDNPVGDTEIEGTDATTISVTERLRYSGNPPQTRYPVAGGQLTLSYSCPGIFNVNSCSVAYLVKIPRRLAVQIDDQVGVIKLTGLAGQLNLRSATGNIDAAGLASNTVTTRTQAGAITLQFSAPPSTVDAQTEVGSITVRLPAGSAYAVDAGSQVGAADVTVQQDPGSVHHITARSRVGSVSVANG
ncbi:MAG: DUF4097 family beta strand repeat protein [Pseudonocardiales bacterium]|nr:DUF4097 family beta strand repeat protein [Pseudonocardiales bacterium]MBV9651823.1 DUF4097 family beta strand repeat protein [Pseudonocardiales bacterium]